MHGEFCKCMTCAGTRYQKAETRARTEESNLFFHYQKEEDRLTVELEIVKEKLKGVKRQKNNLIMDHYRILQEEGGF